MYQRRDDGTQKRGRNTDSQVLLSVLLEKGVTASTCCYLLECSEVNFWKVKVGIKELDRRQYKKLRAFHDSLKHS